MDARPGRLIITFALGLLLVPFLSQAQQPAKVLRVGYLPSASPPPTVFPRDHVDAGGLIAYGPSLAETGRRMAAYVDKILKGAKPGDLPVEVVRRHELIINLKTAREIGVTIPPEVLKRADQVIQ